MPVTPYSVAITDESVTLVNENLEAVKHVINLVEGMWRLGIIDQRRHDALFNELDSLELILKCAFDVVMDEKANLEANGRILVRNGDTDREQYTCDTFSTENMVVKSTERYSYGGIGYPIDSGNCFPEGEDKPF